MVKCVKNYPGRSCIFGHIRKRHFYTARLKRISGYSEGIPGNLVRKQNPHSKHLGFYQINSDSNQNTSNINISHVSRIILCWSNVLKDAMRRSKFSPYKYQILDRPAGQVLGSPIY